MRKIISLLIMMTIWSGVSAQTGDWEDISFEEYLQEVQASNQQILPTDSYSFNTIYSLYKNYGDTHPIESLEGKSICSKGKDFMVDQNSFVTLQNSEMGIKIDVEGKTIYLLEIDSNFFSQQSLKSYSNGFEADLIKKVQHKKLQTNETYYQLIFNQNIDYEAMELRFDAKQKLYKVIIFSKQYLPASEENDWVREKPRIEVEIKDFQKNKDANLAQLLLLSDVVTKENGVWKGKGNYTQYRIVDLRN